MDSLFSGIIVYPFGWQAAITLGIILLLIVLSGYMSSSEVSFFSLSPQDIHLIRESKAPHDQKLLALLENSEKLLATILIGNNIVNIGIVLSSNYLVHLLFDFGINSVLSFVLQTIVLTFVLLLFCEIIPKVYAQQHPLTFSRFSAHIMQPLVKVLSHTSCEDLFYTRAEREKTLRAIRRRSLTSRRADRGEKRDAKQTHW